MLGGTREWVPVHPAVLVQVGHPETQSVRRGLARLFWGPRPGHLGEGRLGGKPGSPASFTFYTDVSKETLSQLHGFLQMQ